MKVFLLAVIYIDPVKDNKDIKKRFTDTQGKWKRCDLHHLYYLLESLKMYTFVQINTYTYKHVYWYISIQLNSNKCIQYRLGNE